MTTVLRRRLSEFLSFLREPSLWAYFKIRLMVVLKSYLNMPPVFPYQDRYHYDQKTQTFIDDIATQIEEEKSKHNIGEGIQRRRQLSDIFKDSVVKILSKEVATCDPQNNINDALNDEGHIHLIDETIKLEEVDDVVNTLKEKPVYPAHIPHFSLKPAMPLQQAKDEQHSCASYSLQDLMSIPTIAKLVSNKNLLDYAENYFGCTPSLFFVNSFWSFKNDNKPFGTQHVHRDVDDAKTLNLIVNLTDTTSNDGVHIYFKNTHSLESFKKIYPDLMKKVEQDPSLSNFRNYSVEDFFDISLNGYACNKQLEELLNDLTVEFSGDRGNMRIADNFGFHRGSKPTLNDRLVLILTYTSYSTGAYSTKDVKKQIRPKYETLSNIIDDNPKNRYIFRDIIDFT